LDDHYDLECAQRSHGSQKKSLETALDDLKNSGGTSYELFVKVSKARKINAVCGYGVVAPWEVGELDEEWSEMFDGLYEYEKQKAEEGRQIAQSKAQFEIVLAKQRADHPSYRKY
jgi:hypothetical protein